MADLGYGRRQLWLPLDVADQNLTKFGLVPVRTSYQSPTYDKSFQKRVFLSALTLRT